MHDHSFTNLWRNYLQHNGIYFLRISKPIIHFFLLTPSWCIAAEASLMRLVWSKYEIEIVFEKTKVHWDLAFFKLTLDFSSLSICWLFVAMSCYLLDQRVIEWSRIPIQSCSWYWFPWIVPVFLLEIHFKKCGVVVFLHALEIGIFNLT